MLDRSGTCSTSLLPATILETGTTTKVDHLALVAWNQGTGSRDDIPVTATNSRAIILLQIATKCSSSSFFPTIYLLNFSWCRAQLSGNVITSPTYSWSCLQTSLHVVTVFLTHSVPFHLRLLLMVTSDWVLLTIHHLCLWQIVARLRAGFCSHKTLPKEYRVQQLRNLRRLVEENEVKIKQALWHDLHKVGVVQSVIHPYSTCMQCSFSSPSHTPLGHICVSDHQWNWQDVAAHSYC